MFRHETGAPRADIVRRVSTEETEPQAESSAKPGPGVAFPSDMSEANERAFIERWMDLMGQP